MEPIDLPKANSFIEGEDQKESVEHKRECPDVVVSALNRRRVLRPRVMILTKGK